MTDIKRITFEPLSLDALLHATEDPSCGALCVFGGTIRDHNDGRAVGSLSYEAHEAIADKAIRAVERETIELFGITRCLIQHRIGHLALGDTSIYVVVRSAHRPQAFEAGRFAIDEVKKRVAIWKEEHYEEGDAQHLSGTPLIAPESEQ